MAPIGYMAFIILAGIYQYRLVHSSTQFPINDLDDFIENLRDCRQIPSLSLAIIKDGQTIVTKGYGDVTTDVPATDRTVFSVASLTKAFTAILLGQLLQENGMSYDTPVSHILPSVQFPSDYVTEHVTVRDLLGHRTGIPRYDWIWLADSMDFPQILSKIRLMESPGFRDKIVYNNIMYALAGHLAEKLGGASWEDLVTNRLLRPLGMNYTTFWKKGKNFEDFAAGRIILPTGNTTQKLGDTAMQGLTVISPAIAMMSSASDMGRWMHFLLRPSRHLADIVAETLKPLTVVQDDPNVYINKIKRPLAEEPLIYDKYGMAWFLGSYRTYQTAMHYGSWIGSYSYITLMPEKNIGIFTSFTGGRQMSPYNINSVLHAHVLDVLLGHVPWMTSQKACEFAYNKDVYEVSDRVDRSQIPVKPLEVYLGSYYHPVFGYCNITQEGSTLQLKYGKIGFELFYSGDESFQATPSTEWGFWHLPVTFKFKGDSVHSVSIPFQKSEVFVKIPDGVDIAEWIRDLERENSPNKKYECSSAISIYNRSHKFVCIIVPLFIAVFRRILFS